MELQQVKNQPSLARNPNSNSIVNQNTKEFNKYIMRRQMTSKGHDRVDIIENDLSRLKDLLSKRKN